MTTEARNDNDGVMTLRDAKGKERMLLPPLPPLPEGARLDVEIVGDFGKLVAALCAVVWPTITKDARNPHLGSKFADLASLSAQLKPALAKQGLAVLQPSVASTNGVTVVTILAHTSGAYVRGSLFLPVYLPVAGVSDEQAYGKAYTYGRRYGYQAVLDVAAENDEDGHAVRDYRDARPATSPKPSAAHPAGEHGADPRPISKPANGSVPKVYEPRMRAAKDLVELRRILTEVNEDRSLSAEERTRLSKVKDEVKASLEKASVQP